MNSNVSGKSAWFCELGENPPTHGWPLEDFADIAHIITPTSRDGVIYGLGWGSYILKPCANTTYDDLYEAYIFWRLSH